MGRIRKYYLVINRVYDGDEILGLFSSRVKAETYIATDLDRKYFLEIEEFILDNPLYNLKNGVRFFHHQAYEGNFFQSAHYTAEEAWGRANEMIEKERQEHKELVMKEYYKGRDPEHNPFQTIIEDYSVREYDIGGLD